MDWEFMKDLMGDSYKEGITLDEVKEIESSMDDYDIKVDNGGY